jgi:simple sugar transport system substrate-binding protein
MRMRIVAYTLTALACAACANTDRAPRAAADSTSTRADTRIVVVTHGQSSDPFWSVVANGVGDAANDLGVRVEYQAPTSFDMVRMSEIIDAAIASKPAALIVSVPDPDALGAGY